MSIHKQMRDANEKEEQLVTELIKREGELRSAKRELQKNKKDRDRAERTYKSLGQSRTRKLIMPIRHILALWSSIPSIFQRQKALVEQNRKLLEHKMKLKQALEDAQKELKESRKKVKMLMIKPRTIDDDALRKIMRRSRDTGELIDDLNRLISEKKAYDHNYREALKYAARLFTHEQPEFREMVFNRVLSGLRIDDIPEVIVRYAETESAIPLKQASSFKASLSMRARMGQLGLFMPECVLDNKEMAYRFVDELNIKRPRVKREKFKYANIPKMEGIVIKPAQGAGSRGVYLVFEFNRIQDVRRSQILHSWDALLEHIEKDFAADWVKTDEWVVEELVYEDDKKRLPARDIKFYCFYGKIGLILEIKRFPSVKYCWWTPNGEKIRTGKYEEELFSGLGVSEEEVEMVASISFEIPAPFMRIDFLKSHEGLVFGEFTPRPGNYDEFNALTDQMLGDHFLDAKGRLMNDLLSGKQFNHFHKIAKGLDIFSSTNG